MIQCQHLKDVGLQSDNAAVPGDVCVLPSHFLGETYRDEIYVDTSTSLPAASDDISTSTFSGISFLHRVDAREPTLFSQQ